MRFITLNEDNIVVGIRFGDSLAGNEIQSDLGEINQRMLKDGTFEDVVIESGEQEPTLEDKVNFLYYREKGMI